MTKKKATKKPNAGAEKPKVGHRPKFVPDIAAVEKLAMMGCTEAEIAAFLGCSKDTLIEVKKRDQEYVRALEHGREKGKISLRRRQWKCAEDGSVAMQIWLGKQLLGQSDKASIDAQVTTKELPASVDDFV